MFKDVCKAGLMTLVLLGSSVIQAAEIPELGAPSSLSGASTTAAFFAGVTADQGATYKSAFNPSDALDINAQFRVEAAHVNSVGNLYVLIGAGTDIFMRLTDGSFVLWNGDPAGLQPAAQGITFKAVENLSVAQKVAFGPLGLAGMSFAIYLGYDLGAIDSLRYSGQPATFTVAAQDGPDPTQVALDFFTANVSNQITQQLCFICHNSAGPALATRLVYVAGTEPNSVQQNFEILKNFILNTPDGAGLVISKPQQSDGVTHLGGTQIQPGSQNQTSLVNFVNLVKAIPPSGSGSSQSALMQVSLLDNEGTLRKAALLFAGRLPTAAELQQVSTGGDAQLRSTIRELMDGDGFKAFLTEGANDHLLSLGVQGNAFQALNRYHYPKVDELLTNGSRNERNLTAEAVAREPLELIAHVVMNERPYTEILTADYIMVNPYSAAIYGGSVVFDDPTDTTEWREGEITEYYRCSVCTGPADNAKYDIATVYPHAGLLNSPMFLARFPSTETNRNRARARWAYYFFLGVDIEGLSERTTDPAALADEDNPTLKNPNCTVCHDIMDPVAGAFQNYGDDGRYRDKPGGYDALPLSYKRDRNGGYKAGDRWYGDMLAPGFGDLLAPSPDESLQWLGQEFAKDSRFGYGAVNFWFPAVLGRDPLDEPVNPEDADFLAKQLAYSTEQALMKTIASDFMDGAQGNGPFNLKDLLVDLALSAHFRAAAADGLTAQQLVELEGVGIGRLLTPEQLSRKLQYTTGYDWSYGQTGALDTAYLLLYGGIDSLGITERITELTTLMSTVVTTMANEASCPMVAQDFGRPRSQRYLFPDVEPGYLPTTQATAIQSNIQHLHNVLLGEDLAINDPEVLATFELFKAAWQARVAANKGAAVSSVTELCLTENATNPVLSDSSQTVRAWIVVLNYLLRDYRFIHE
ncbi:MAG: hypothetical protein RLZZ385_976 [Pseudomonadota bacterium]|jgi:hypothetical protein